MSVTARITTLFALILGMFLTGCERPASAPRVELLSPTETAELLKSATSVEPVGEAVVTISSTDDTTTVAATQIFSFRLNDDSGGQTGRSCMGSCKVVGPGGLDGCITSGCMPTSTGCTPLKCSGNCSLSSSCSAGTSMTVFAQ